MWHVFQPLGEPAVASREPPLNCTPAPPEAQASYGVNNYDYRSGGNAYYEPQNYSGQWLGPVNDGVQQWPATQVVYQDTTMAINSNPYDVKL